jgi:hypothetical protein
MKSLEKIRKEWSERPLPGPDVEKIESRIPKRADLVSEPGCVVKNCNASTFRGSDMCKFHFLEVVKQRELQRKKDEEEAHKRMNHKDYWKQFTINQFQGANRICSACGKYGLHVVREKSKDKRPIRPNHYSECLEAICHDCVEAGR